MFCFFCFQIAETTIAAIACGVFFCILFIGVIAFIYYKRGREGEVMGGVRGGFELLNNSNVSGAAAANVVVNPAFIP